MVCVRRFIGVCFYRCVGVCRCVRDVVMQGTCLTLASRVTILPECMCSRAPRREDDIAGNIADIMAVASTYALVRAKRRR